MTTFEVYADAKVAGIRYSSEPVDGFVFFSDLAVAQRALKARMRQARRVAREQAAWVDPYEAESGRA